MLKIEQRLSIEETKEILKETGYTNGFLKACRIHAETLQIIDKADTAKLIAFALAMFASGYDICSAQKKNAPT